MLLSSCLKKNVEEIEEFDNNNISNIAGVWFRYVTTGGTSTTSSGEVLRKVELNNISSTINNDTKTIDLKVAPSTSIMNQIPANIRNELTLKNIAVVVTLPTAARIAPIGDSPKLGVNGDWSKPNKYIVTAANGNQAEWTINFKEITLP